MVFATAMMIAVDTVAAAMTVATIVFAASSSPARKIIVAVASRLGSVAAALVGLHAPANCLGGNSGTNFDIGLLNTHTGLDGTAAATAERGSQHPLAVGFGELVDGNDADTSRIVAAVSRTEADTPASLCNDQLSLHQRVQNIGNLHEGALLGFEYPRCRPWQ